MATPDTRPSLTLTEKLITKVSPSDVPKGGQVFEGAQMVVAASIFTARRGAEAGKGAITWAATKIRTRTQELAGSVAEKGLQKVLPHEPVEEAIVREGQINDEGKKEPPRSLTWDFRDHRYIIIP